MPGSVSLLTIEFLSWLAARPRSHAEVKEAWRSTCPLTCAWEDALDRDLVRLSRADGRAGAAMVELTPRGRALLAERRAAAAAIPLDPARPRL